MDIEEFDQCLQVQLTLSQYFEHQPEIHRLPILVSSKPLSPSSLTLIFTMPRGPKDQGSLSILAA